jgi:hypothetical protein
VPLLTSSRISPVIAGRGCRFSVAAEGNGARLVSCFVCSLLGPAFAQKGHSRGWLYHMGIAGKESLRVEISQARASLPNQARTGLLYPIKPEPGLIGAQPAVHNLFFNTRPFHAGCLHFWGYDPLPILGWIG